MRPAAIGFLVLLLLNMNTAAARPIACFEYLSPRPGAELVAKETTIILRPGTRAKDVVASIAAVEVRGSTSDLHTGEWITAGRGDTFIFRPHQPFAPGERVSVTGTIEGETCNDFSFNFSISPKTRDLRRDWIEPPGADPCDVASPENALDSSRPRAPWSLPTGFPALTVTINDDPAPGYVFFGSLEYAAMLDNTGSPGFFRQFNDRPSDFKKQTHGGAYSYLQFGDSEFKVMDESFEVLGGVSPENGYAVLDGHDFQIAPNGNALVGIKDFQNVDMSTIVPGGDPNAIVVGFVMQEQDTSHNVVFEWRSWDHFEITDATGIDLTAPHIDYVHFNAFEYDTDGNILISSREIGEITKIDRQTGDIIWRMGGSQNEFALVGDTRWFTRQHSVRRTPTGTVTIFDNGNLSTPLESRAVEYALDEVNKIATMVWEFRNDPPLFSSWASNVQRLPNGNTLICWTPLGIVMEVRSDGTKAFEMVFDEEVSYRAFRFEWDGVSARPELWYEADPGQVTLHFAKFGDPDVAQFHIYSGNSPEPMTRVGSTPANWFVLDAQWPETLHVRVTAADSTGMVESPFSNEIVIVVPIPVNAPIVGSPGSGLALHQNHPNPFAPSTTISFVLPDEGFVDLSVYDVRGDLVRRLTHDVMAPGLSHVVWDGADASGRRVMSGVYFCRLEAARGVRSRRMVVLR